MDFDTDIKPKLTALARHGLTAAAGVLLPMGVLSKTTEGAFIDAGVSVALFGGAVAWSFIQKELQKTAVQQALATPVAGTFSLDQAATMLAPLITQAITQAINDALPVQPPPSPPAALSATVLPAVVDTPSIAEIESAAASQGVQANVIGLFKPPFGPQS